MKGWRLTAAAAGAGWVFIVFAWSQASRNFMDDNGTPLSPYDDPLVLLVEVCVDWEACNKNRHRERYGPLNGHSASQSSLVSITPHPDHVEINLVPPFKGPTPTRGPTGGRVQRPEDQETEQHL